MNSRTFETTGRVLTAALAALTALALSTGVASAQQGTVTGQVVDASNLEPVVGAQVFFPDLDQGTLTNEEGRYRITGVPAGQHEIRVRLLGYRPASQNVTVEGGATATVDFQLSVSAVSLGEIVVTQTGEQEARELGRAVSTIQAEGEVQKSKAGSVQDLIKGRATGTTIRSSSGSVGTGSTFQIRGNSTLTLGNTPIIYIDGVRVSNNNSNLGGMFSGNFFTGGQQTSRISDLNPEDIESIQVLKGPSATTLYGAEAASGVLVIETKSGSAGDTRFTGRAEVGGNWDDNSYMNTAYNPTDDPTVELGFAKDTVYLMDLLGGKSAGIASPFRTGFEQNYGGTARGGLADGDVTYYVSGEYVSQEGNLPSNAVEKWSGRANFNVDPSETVDISVSTGFTANTTDLPQNDNNAVGYIGNAQLGLAFWDRFDRTNAFGGGGSVRTCPLAFELARVGFGPLGALSASQCSSPFLALNFDDIGLVRTTDDTQRFTGSSQLTWRPTDFLTGRLSVGYDEIDTTNEQFWPVVPRLDGVFEGFEGEIQKAKTRTTNLSLQPTLTAEFDVTEEVTSSTTAGVQYLDEQSDQIYVQCLRFPAGSPACDNAVDLQKTGSNDFFFETRALGYFAEQQFSWRNRLFLTGGLRVDDNSAFGEQLSAEWLPQASLSYVMSEEEWFPEFFEQFKLRGAWGVSGELPGTNDALALLGTTQTPFQGDRLLGVTPQQPSNAELEPARVSEIEAGFDMSILDGRLSGEFTWYRQTTKDDIVSRPLPPSSGFPGSQSANVGELVNTGVEASVTATAFSTPDLNWDWQAQVSTNYNEITELANPIDLGFGQRHAEGRPFASYFQPCAFFNDAGELEIANDGVSVFECPGEPGGDPTPNVNGSLSSTVTLFGHVTMYALAEYATGHQVQDNTEEFICEFIDRCASVFETNADGQLTDQARLDRFASRFNTELNFVDDGDYVKLRTVSLRFDVPDEWTGFFSGRDVSFQLTGENLARWFGYRRDPEQTSGGQQQDGFFADFLTVPPAKRVTASFQVAF